jgi:hypothetical protein
LNTTEYGFHSASSLSVLILAKLSFPRAAR